MKQSIGGIRCYLLACKISLHSIVEVLDILKREHIGCENISQLHGSANKTLRPFYFVSRGDRKTVVPKSSACGFALKWEGGNLPSYQKNPSNSFCTVSRCVLISYDAIFSYIINFLSAVYAITIIINYTKLRIGSCHLTFCDSGLLECSHWDALPRYRFIILGPSVLVTIFSADHLWVFRCYHFSKCCCSLSHN